MEKESRNGSEEGASKMYLTLMASAAYFSDCDNCAPTKQQQKHVNIVIALFLTQTPSVIM